ncbi:MAG: phosphoenolpyruvate synthase regulatory protein [Candidatus Dactylopiibacterium carminicum]|uniref:Putative phosphoenolpyruvate synthase regulatory protein n=1 Tax=Candidatus Dactylopiibacterium carminicum TaxID=857335 RepID=A0A272EV88_9RHOO|nr:kinase/pyrophosphorylase [Candidatus Dactylopiibacterium carminicum]PAS94023.1 MAG: phosphoenolpyruvate synthase regulatory protein [Candidatus Dactylopiibacterium carminicum]PAS98223.1 MAG: phosphoenolpyruvate synthase regulatory protein [Candidatus Dactylopiibacterium carminicum]
MRARPVIVAFPYASFRRSALSGIRSVFFISDGTGITAETLGHSLLAQFQECRFRLERLPFVDSQMRAQACVRQIRAAAMRDGVRPIVVSTIVDAAVVAALREADALFLDLFEQSIGPLEAELGVRASHSVGRSHGITESASYFARIEAINFTLAHDDGQSHERLNEADVILIGVSRSGKTPTSLYLALQFGIKAANYPLIPEDFERDCLPPELLRHRGKLFGLSISPLRLAQIRSERRPGSRYAQPDNCNFEVEAALQLMQREGVAVIDSTARSIEELAALILQAIQPAEQG